MLRYRSSQIGVLFLFVFLSFSLHKSLRHRKIFKLYDIQLQDRLFFSPTSRLTTVFIKVLKQLNLISKYSHLSAIKLNFTHCQVSSIKKRSLKVCYRSMNQLILVHITFGKRVGNFLHVEGICLKYLESVSQFTHRIQRYLHSYI